MTIRRSVGPESTLLVNICKVLWCTSQVCTSHIEHKTAIFAIFSDIVYKIQVHKLEINITIIIFTMPLPQYLKYNPKASYRLGTVFDYTKDERAQVAALLKSQDIYISDQNFFKTDWFDLSQKYIMPHITTQAVIDAWSSNPMQFWQNQLQFALWCATAGCGVSVKDHLLNENLRPLARSFFRFHVYYQTRRILAEMKCPLPTRDSWNAFNNGIDHHAYQRICGEFQVDYKHTEAWHLTEKQCPSNGMGHTCMRVNFYINVNNAFDIPGVPVLVNHHDAYCGEIIIPHWGAYDKFVHKFDTPLDYDGL